MDALGISKQEQADHQSGQSVWSGPFFLPIQGVDAHASLNWYAVGSVLETRRCLDTHVIGPPRGRNSMKGCSIWVNSHGEVTTWAPQYRTQVPHPTRNQKQTIGPWWSWNREVWQGSMEPYNHETACRPENHPAACWNCPQIYENA